jgi:large subunit ribosomal protein L1
MGRPKVVVFTGLEDLESHDSRPAKKKKSAAAKARADKAVTANPTEVISESTGELVTDLAQEAKTEELKTEKISAEETVESTDQLAEELVVEAVDGQTPEANIDKIEDEVAEELASESKTDEAIPVKVQPKVGVAKIRSKRYQEIHALVEKGKAYPLLDALQTLKTTSKTKFDPTVEIHINIGADITKTDQQVRITTTLPHASGKTPKLLVFGPSFAKASEDKTITFGDDKTIETIEKTGRIEAEKIIASPDWMPKLTKVAKILGPKGLMPNPKTGTVTTDVAKTVADFKGGLLEIRTEVGGPIIHSKVGKLSLGEEKLAENLKALIDAVSRAKPAGIKRNYLKSVYLHVTMGPSIKLDLSSLSTS